MAQPSSIDRAFFRETEAGTVFFPWGLAHRSYRLPDEAAKARARRAVSLLLGCTLAIAAWLAEVLKACVDSGTPSLGGFASAAAAPLVALCCVVAAYVAWGLRFTERYPESDLKVPWEERVRDVAEEGAPRKLTLCGVALVGLSALLLALDPRGRWIALLGVATGAGVLVFAWVIRRTIASEEARRGSRGELAGRG